MISLRRVIYFWGEQLFLNSTSFCASKASFLLKLLQLHSINWGMEADGVPWPDA